LEKVTEEHSPGAHKSWGRINTLYSHLKTRFKRNLDQNMLKNALVFGKKEKSPQRPQPPVGLRRLGIRPQQTPQLLLLRILLQLLENYDL